MTTYTLTAILGKSAKAVSFEQDNDKYAMLESVGKILRLASEDPTGPWAKGEIILRDEDGNTVAGMDAK